MGFEGHVFDSIAKMKWSRNQQQLRRERVAKIREMYVGCQARHFSPQASRPISDQQRAEIRQRLRREDLRARVKTAVICGVIFLVLVVGVLIFGRFFI